MTQTNPTLGQDVTRYMVLKDDLACYPNAVLAATHACVVGAVRPNGKLV